MHLQRTKERLESKQCRKQLKKINIGESRVLSLAVLTKDEQMLSSCCQGDSSEPQFGGKDQSCFVALHIKYAQEGMRVNHASLQES